MEAQISIPTNTGKSESPFEPFFGTNYFASDALEVKEISSIIHAHEQELALLEDEITRQESILQDLNLQRDQISLSVRNHRLLLSNTCRLAPELLAEIFIHCLPSNHLPTRSSSEAPLVLLSVCKRWREIAIKTPRLWCGLHVHMPNYPLRNSIMERRVEGVKQWLERSGGDLPLSLSIYCPRRLRHFVNLGEEVITGRNIPPGLATFVHELVEKYSRRWKSLEVMLPLDAMSFITSLQPQDMPILQHFSVSHSSFHSFDTDALFEFITRIPSLRTLSLNHDFVLERLHVPSISLTNTLNNLTELYLKPTLPTCMPANKALDILSQTPNLRSCTMHVLVPASMVLLETRQQPIILSSLHTLDLSLGHDLHEAMTGSLLLPVFRQLSLPNLETLNIHAPNIIVQETYIPFLDYLTERIRNLLFEIQMTAKAWIECLRRVPRLVSLAGKCCESDYVPIKVHTNKWEQVLKLLGSGSGNLSETAEGEILEPVEILCPELKVINISLTQDFGVRQLLDLAIARQRMPQRGYAGNRDRDRDRNSNLKLNAIAAQFAAYEKLTKEDWDLTSQLREGGTNLFLRIPPNPLAIDTPWYRIPKTSLLDGREIMWDWPDEHSLDFEGWRCVYSTEKEFVNRVGM
jgi:hypothetical protein